MTSKNPKIFTAYNTQTGQIYWYDQFVSETEAQHVAVFQNTIANSSDWKVIKLKYIEPVDSNGRQLEITGNKQFEFNMEDLPYLESFMHGVKIAEQHEENIYSQSSVCLDKDEYFGEILQKGLHAFYIKNKELDTHNVLGIERDDDGEPLCFNSFEDASYYMSNKIKSKKYRVNSGQFVQKLFVIYNAETNHIANFVSNIKHPNIEWSSNVLKRLKTLLNLGLSAYEIAIYMGIPKNALVGKINRLGWKLQNAQKVNIEKLPQKSDIIQTIVSTEHDVCHGIFLTKNSAEQAAKQLNLMTNKHNVWRVARLKYGELSKTLPSHDISIILGENDFKLDLYAIKRLLITGRTGTGKTTLLKSILTSINHQPKTANCKIVLIDTKDFDFNGYSSKYLITPVITNAKKAVEYLNKVQPQNEDIIIIIDELEDLIAVQNDIITTLTRLSTNPNIHIVVATRRNDLPTCGFDSRITLNRGKFGEALYVSFNELQPIYSYATSDRKDYTMTEKMFSKSWFFNLDKTLRDNGLDSDLYSFDEIFKRIKDDKFKASPDEFASCAAYSILASGFRQKTAKHCHQKIMDKLSTRHTKADLLRIFNRDTKINAIMEIWNNRDKLCDGYYKCKSLEDKLNFLKKLPNLGNITKDHLARNLGEDVVKYDIWVQRLGIIYSGNPKLEMNNANLKPDVKQACDDMFNHLTKETGFPRGYIDAVLFKAASNGLIEVVEEKKKGKK